MNPPIYRFELRARQLGGEMVRMTDAAAPSVPTWSVRDHFELDPKIPQQPQYDQVLARER